MKLDLPRDREFEAGVWYSTPASSWYPTHYHDELELKLVLWGRAMYQVGTARLELGPGSLLWLGPGQEHTLLGLSDELAMWVASFRPCAVRVVEKSLGTRFLDRALNWNSCVLATRAVQELSARHAELAGHEEPRQVNPLARRLLARALEVCEADKRIETPNGARLPIEPRPLHPAVARARTLLRGPDSDLSLEDLSRRCGLAGPHLSRLFKRQMGLSIVRFRNHHRVQQFVARFGRGDRQTMLEAALNAGFGSYPQFHRAFRQVTGYAPAEHLRRVSAGIVVPTHQDLGVVEGGPDIASGFDDAT